MLMPCCKGGLVFEVVSWEVVIQHTNSSEKSEILGAHPLSSTDDKYVHHIHMWSLQCP